MADLRISELPLATGPTSPAPTDFVALDGSTTRKAPLSSLADAIRPLASQAEAEAGVNAVKGMSPLTTAQAISAQAATAAQGDLADTALQPGDAATPAQGTKADTALQPNTTISVEGVNVGDVGFTYNNNNELVVNEGDFFTFGNVGGIKLGPSGIILGRDGTDTAMAFVASVPNTKTEVVINPSGTPATDEWTVFSINRIAGANEERLNYAARGGSFNDYILGQVVIGSGQYRPLRWRIAGNPTLTVNTNDDVLFHQRIGVGVPEGVRPTQLLEVRGNGTFGVAGGVLDYGIELRTASADWKNQVSASNGSLYWLDQINNKFPLVVEFNSPSSALVIQANTTNAVNILVGGATKTIEVGAADSGGAGYRMLRVVN